MNEKHFASRILAYTAVLMSISGILLSVCAKIAFGGILFAAASCMYFVARNLRIAEDRSGD